MVVKQSFASGLMLALALTLPLSSCASIITGSSDSVEVRSSPTGAAFVTNTGHRGTTPATITIPDDISLQVSYTMDGYKDVTITLPPRMSGWFLANLIIGGIIGIIIDLASGNWRVHDGEVTAVLTPVDAAP